MAAIWSRLSRSYRDAGRLVRAAVLTLLVASVFTAVNAVDPVLPWVVVWLPGTVGSFLVVIDFGLTARARAPARAHPPAVAAPVRWSPCWCCSAASRQAIEVLRAEHPEGAHVAPLQMAFDGTAILMIIWALIRLPLGKQSRGEVIRVLMDAGTVMLACAVFVWHFSTRFAIARRRPAADLHCRWRSPCWRWWPCSPWPRCVLTSHSSYLDGGALRMIGAGGADRRDRPGVPPAGRS